MTAPANAPVDVMAILTDLQQQVSDLTGVFEAQQRTLGDLSRIVQSQDHALRLLLPASPRLYGPPTAPTAPAAAPVSPVGA